MRSRRTGRAGLPLRALRTALAFLIGTAGVAMVVPPASAATAATPTPLSVVVPIIVPSEMTGIIGADALARYTSPLGRLTQQLDAVAGRTVTLAIDPRIIVSVRVLGSEAPPSAVAWLQRLALMPQESFALPYANADVTLATQAGSPLVPAPTSLEFAIDPALFEIPEPAPSASPEPPGAVPTTESLLDWPHDHEVLWPTERSVIASDLTVFSASAVSTLMLSSSNVATGAAAHSSASGFTVFVTDEAVSLALRSSVAAVDDPTWTTEMDALTTAIGARSAPVVATLSREMLWSTSRLSTTLAALASDPNVQLVPLSTVASGAPEETTLVDAPHETEMLAAIRPLVEFDARVDQFSNITANPELLSGERRVAMLACLDAGWSDNPTGRARVIDVFSEATTDILDSVQIVDSSDVNFFTDRSNIQVPVRNDLDQAVTVTLSVVPDRPLVDVETDRVEITLEPNSVRNAPVPVQSISNGTVRLTMTLHGADDEQVGATTRLTVNVQAGWEGPIVAVLAVIVVLVFAGGLVRNILLRRRARE